jgi:predicted HicB family RNase H-like nuclease
MPKTSAISVRVPDEVKAAAEKAAAADGRSVASYVEKLLTEHLRKSGFLKGKRND